jgi:hypothetical protein
MMAWYLSLYLMLVGLAMAQLLASQNAAWVRQNLLTVSVGLIRRMYE